MKNYYLLVISSVFFLSNTPAFSASDHNHEHEASEQHAPHHEEGDHDEHEDHVDHDEDGHDHDEHEHGEENSSRIEDKMASKVGIVTSVSGPQELHQTITVFGSIVSAPEQMSHVRARFEGLVKTVKVTLGDRVKAGDVLLSASLR